MLTKQIDYILELSRTLNFSSAAENLFISQPTLSYQIKTLEEELGFVIFERRGRIVDLTPAGKQFCETLQHIRSELQRAIEQGQSFGAKYSETITIGMGVRSMLRYLPEAIRRFAETNPTTDVIPYFQYYGMEDSFLRGEKDILFAVYDHVRRYHELRFHKLYTSGIYLVAMPDDPLAKKERIRPEDLAGRTLMVGGGSPNALRSVQQRVIQEVHVEYFNSPDHDNTLTNIAAGKGIVLAPGFLNDHTGQFAWIPFDCPESLPCVLCTHSDEQRKEVLSFVRTLQDIYAARDEEPM